MKRKMQKFNLLLVAAVVVSSITANEALALTTTQLDYPGATRSFTLVTENFFSTAGGWTDRFVSAGEGNITGNKNIPTGWTVAVNGSKSGFSTDIFEVITGTNSYEGSFALKSTAWNIYDRIAIGLKTGNADRPDWAIIELAQYAKSGVWSTTPETSGGLSHYMVYSMGDGSAYPSEVVPLPGAFWLFGASLLSLAGGIRRYHVG